MQFVLGLLVIPVSVATTLPRNVHIDGQKFVDSATHAPIVLSGPNVVVKGPPYMPSVSGTTPCKDVTGDGCAATGTCETCTTFNQGDVDNIKARGWNSIRLGVVWAGAQPRDEDALDPDFLQRLHDVLNLTDRNGIHVILDNHGDMVGSASCGNGIPLWFQQKAASDLIGKPLVADFPYMLISDSDVSKLSGYSHCGDDASKWATYADDPNYNLLNECCQAMNSGNPQALGFTSLSQKVMNYLIEDGQGRTDFVRFWSLMAKAVEQHPSAVAAELMNEPMSIWRMHYFDTWRACAEAINAIIPDMSVSLADLGEGAVLPDWLKSISGQFIDISPSTIEWIKASRTVFYAWHWYGNPEKWQDGMKNAQAFSDDWNVPNFATEFMSCDLWNGLVQAGISHSYWHYSVYCNTGPDFGNHTVPTDTFGACILGWGSGSISGVCGNSDLSVLV